MWFPNWLESAVIAAIAAIVVAAFERPLEVMDVVSAFLICFVVGYALNLLVPSRRK